jgi:hypothetical protein
LPEPERLEELLPGVLEGERDRVYGGNWHSAPRAAKMTQQQGTANGAADQTNSESKKNQN